MTDLTNYFLLNIFNTYNLTNKNKNINVNPKVKKIYYAINFHKFK